jgi:SSS family solute:Na+ symporter
VNFALAPADLVIIGVYMAAMAAMGFWLKKRATGRLDAFFLGGRGIPWWMLGLSGCSSYIDIGGTMGMVGVLYYLGLKGIWATNIVWGWLIICFYMAFQAKYIRRSGVMTFAEWNETRFGPGGGTEGARFVAAAFLLVLMVFNLTFISVGIGKFAEEFLPLARWQSTLIVFATVGIYVTAGGFFGVIYTDIVQTVLIFVGAGALAWMAAAQGDTRAFLDARPAEWASIAPTWNLWDGFLTSMPEAVRGSYAHFDAFGPILLASSTWLIFRVLAGPNVWDFQFFLSARSTRDAAVAGGVWTVGHTARWVLAVAFLVLSLPYLGPGGVADGEKIMPLVLKEFPIGVRGLFLAILLAALMSTLSAMINVTSSVAVNDFLKRYLARRLPERGLVVAGQIASVCALVLGFLIGLRYKNVIDIWEIMIFAVVTPILVPATFRWHWWRIGAKGFTWGVAGSAAFIALQQALVPLPKNVYLPLDVGASLAITLAATLANPPADMEVLLRFYSRVRPFGFWGPVRREAVRRGMVPAGDPMPVLDVLNGLLASVLQIALCAVPFCALVGLSREAWAWTAVATGISIVLLFTWYRTLPARDEGEPAPQPPAEAGAPVPAQGAGE